MLLRELLYALGEQPEHMHIRLKTARGLGDVYIGPWDIDALCRLEPSILDRRVGMIYSDFLNTVVVIEGDEGAVL